MINIANNYTHKVIKASNHLMPLIKILAKKANLTSDNKDFFTSTIVYKWAQLGGSPVKTILENHKKYGTDMEEEDIVSFERLASKSFGELPKAMFSGLTPNEIDDITIYTNSKL
jgi:hypothetical protein